MSEFANVVSPDCDLVLKIIMVGDSGVGKSCLLKAFMGDPFNQGYTSTIGVDFEIKPIKADGRNVNLQIWDTAGQERFRTITTSYYRSSDAILLVFDLSDRTSFKNLEAWLEDVHRYARENVDIMLLGNKLDLERERKISYEDAKEFADKHGMLYRETSAKTHYNVDESFTQITIAACNTHEQAYTGGNKAASNSNNGNTSSNSSNVDVSDKSTTDSGCCGF